MNTHQDSEFKEEKEWLERRKFKTRKAWKSRLFWVNTRRFALTNKDQEGANPGLQEQNYINHPRLSSLSS